VVGWTGVFQMPWLEQTITNKIDRLPTIEVGASYLLLKLIRLLHSARWLVYSFLLFRENYFSIAFPQLATAIESYRVPPTAPGARD
jgi:hypothetical protein